MAAALWFAPGDASAAEEHRYQAVFANGQRATGKKLSSWHDADAAPRLDSTNLADRNRPLRWLRDLELSVEESSPGQAFVEFFGGDRLPGVVAGFDSTVGDISSGGASPPHLVVEPSIELGSPDQSPGRRMRVLPRSIRRVVWHHRPSREYRPGTLFYRSGKAVPFRGLRWADGEVRILTEEGPHRIPFGELAEIHLPRLNAWDNYYRNLGLLSPDLASRLMRIETTAGLIATTSLDRLRPSHHGSTSNSDDWRHQIQPAWSLDLITVPFRTIHTWIFSDPWEVLLTGLPIRASRRQSLAGDAWRPRVNRNVQGGPLRSGGQHHGWGLGVHAFSEVEFELSPLARQFSTKIGLDRVAGAGGCARARIFLNDSKGQPLFQSQHLVGSAQGVSTGAVDLPHTPGKSTRLVLQADPAASDRPAGSDPLDIRDTLDWLEPLVLLDRDKLREKIAPSTRRWLTAWNGWKVDTPAGGSFRIGNEWCERCVEKPGFHLATYIQGEMVLSRRLRVGPDDNWLVLAVRRGEKNSSDRLVVRVDGEEVASLGVPYTYSAGAPIEPLSVPIVAYHGREIDLSIVHRRGETEGPLFWDSIALRREDPYLYRVLEEGRESIEPEPAESTHVRLARGEAYSGLHSLTVKAGGDAEVVDLQLPIREKPAIGEYRYMRFAIKKEGAGRAYLELMHAAREKRPFRYDAGTSGPALGQAVCIWPHATMDEWVVVTRDLFHDFGAFDLQSVKLAMLDEGTGHFDHIYLSRDIKDLEKAVTERSLSPGEANRVANAMLFDGAKEKIAPALVRLNVAGRIGGGVIVSPEGKILTTGYLAGRPGEKVKIRLADGTELSGVAKGINRDLDLAIVEAETPEPLPKAEIGDAGSFGAGGLLLAVAYADVGWGSTALGSAVAQVHGDVDQSKWVSIVYSRPISGGVMVDSQGRVVSIISRAASLGGCMCPHGNRAIERVGRMAKGEVWGEWPLSLTPALGAVIGPTRQQFEVLRISPGGPAAQAGLQVGDHVLRIDGREVASLQDVLVVLAQKLIQDEITIDYVRAGQQKSAKVKLVSRR
jgi:putative serine protease PepD